MKTNLVLDKLKSEIRQSGKIPNHVAIIMDGNGRWAKSKGLNRVAGHKVGIDSVREIVEAAAEVNINYLTLYTFSTENWKRPKNEVSTLMRLLVSSLKKEMDELNKNNVKLETIGDFSALPSMVQKQFLDAKEKTKNNTKLTLVLALSYSGRWEIIEAIKNICNDVKNNDFDFNQLSCDNFSNFLSTKNIPDPDLVIRTSGEFRVSNFLLWQVAYSEFYISDVFWPDFRKLQFFEAIRDFQKRERRFGKVSEQLK